jgi:hypothetical protein
VYLDCFVHLSHFRYPLKAVKVMHTVALRTESSLYNPTASPALVSPTEVFLLDSQSAFNIQTELALPFHLYAKAPSSFFVLSLVIYVYLFLYLVFL